MQLLRSLPVRGLPPSEKRQRIFEATREVIAEHGFDAAKMGEIAARAGVGKGTLYNFFESKEDLLLSLVSENFERMRDLIDSEVDAVTDPWERVEVAWRTLMLRVFPQLLREWNLNYQLWGFLARDAVARERLFHRWREMYREREERIADAIAEGEAGGHFRNSVERKALALLLMSVFDGLVHRAMFDAERIDPEATLLAVLDLLRTVLVRPPG